MAFGTLTYGLDLNWGTSASGCAEPMSIGTSGRSAPCIDRWHIGFGEESQVLCRMSRVAFTDFGLLDFDWSFKLSKEW